MGEQKSILDYADIRKSVSADVEGNITELLDKLLIIDNIEWKEGQYGLYAVVNIRNLNNKKYRVTSQVLLEQLKEIQKHVLEGVAVSVIVEKYKNYYRFIGAKDVAKDVAKGGLNE